MNLRSFFPMVSAVAVFGIQQAAALSLPVSMDSFTSTHGTISVANGKAASLTIKGPQRALLHFDLEGLPGSLTAQNITSARLRFFISRMTRPGGIAVHRVTGEWSEDQGTAAPELDPVAIAPIPSIKITGRRFVTVDITETVRQWVSNPDQNHGLALVASGDAPTLKATIGSKEGTGVGYPAEVEIDINPVGELYQGGDPASGKLDGQQIASGTIGSLQLAPLSVLSGNLGIGVVTNAKLAKSSITINAGSGLSGGGTAELGGIISLQNAGVLSVVGSGGITVSGASGEVTLGSNATPLNLPNTIVMRDGSGNLSVGSITASSFSGDGGGLTNVAASTISDKSVTLAKLNPDLASLIEGMLPDPGFVRVGHINNPPDPVNKIAVPGIGSVWYSYQIGRTEVVNDEYVSFLNAVAATDPYGLYNLEMATDPQGGILRTGASGAYSYAIKPGMNGKPVVFVSWYDAIRFCNWIHNGRATGASDNTTTEGGAYQLGGVHSVAVGTAPENGGNGRNMYAKCFLPSDNEWYKAAYYQPSASGGDSDGYWLYPTKSNDAPVATLPNTTDPNSANLDSVVNGGNLTFAGAYVAARSYYGTFDQAGNTNEWTEATIGAWRGLRGGSWNGGATSAVSTYRNSFDPTAENGAIGFRIAKP